MGKRRRHGQYRLADRRGKKEDESFGKLSVVRDIFGSEPRQRFVREDVCSEHHYDLPACSRIALWLRQSSVGAGGAPGCAARTCTSSWNDTREDEENWIVSRGLSLASCRKSKPQRRTI